MTKTEMLKKNYEFKKVITKGKFHSKKSIQIVILKNKKNINLLGIAIGTKNGKSFQRNKAKRIIREAYRSLEPEMNVGNSMVILLKKGYEIKNIKFDEIKCDMKSIFEDVEIIKKKKKIL
ncbi:MAG: ribonuclease P protein component [Clostridia bacterium]|nr:ribonuclease P protein component [Clostridia bacterium]